jgi:hypothetical protein
VELSTCHFFYWFTIEVRFVIFSTCVLNFDCALIPIEDLSVLSVYILVFSELKSVILAHAVDITCFTHITAVLEP